MFLRLCGPPSIPLSFTVARGIAYMINGNRNTDNIGKVIGTDSAKRFQDFFYYGKLFGVYLSEPRYVLILVRSSLSPVLSR